MGQPPTFAPTCVGLSLAQAVLTSEFGMGSGRARLEMPPFVALY